MAVSVTPIEFLRLLYFPAAAEGKAGFHIRFTSHARLLGKNKISEIEAWEMIAIA